MFSVVGIRFLLLARPATHILQASGWVSPFYEADGLRGNNMLKTHITFSQRDLGLSLLNNIQYYLGLIRYLLSFGNSKCPWRISLWRSTLSVWKVTDTIYGLCDGDICYDRATCVSHLVKNSSSLNISYCSLNFWFHTQTVPKQNVHTF